MSSLEESESEQSTEDFAETLANLKSPTRPFCHLTRQALHQLIVTNLRL